ncbi:MAG: hypothetical protein ABR564_01180 [Candidatus Dormibacteria bacterium]
MGSSPRGGRPSASSGAELLGLGTFIAVALVVPLIAGLTLDDALHSSPLGLGLGLLIGIVASCGGVYMRYRRYS